MSDVPLIQWVSDLFDSSSSLRWEVRRYAEGAGGLMIFCAAAAGVVAAASLLWALLRLLMIEPSRDAVRLIASRLALCLRSQRPAAPALAGLRPLLPWPHPARLAAAAQDLGSDAPPTLVGALTQRRLLPSSLAGLARSAERLGPVVLEGWLRALARPPRMRSSLGRRLGPPVITVVGIYVILVFIGLFIAPKFIAVLRDVGMPSYAPMERISMLAGSALALAVCSAVPLSLAAVCWARWRWLLARRLLRGELILQSVQAGLPESSIASALSLSEATALPALCLAAGWRARDADELALAIAAARERRDRAAAVAMSVFEIAAPLLLALPVLALARSIFGAIIAIITHLDATI